MSEIEKLKVALLAKKRKYSPFSKENVLSTGLTLLDKAMGGGFLKGHYYLFVGDSQAGKSWLLLQTMAEATQSRHFDRHRLIHDNPERGALMDVRRYFGKNLAIRLEPPSKRGRSHSLEEFYRNVRAAAAVGKSFLYGLDSEDALPPERDMKDDEKGSYGTDKAKINSSKLRVAHNSLEATGSILIMVKQSRQNIGWDATFTPKTRSGGLALTFYGTVELWFSIKGKIKKTIWGKPRVIGTILKIHVKKNRMVGRDRVIEVPFYPNAGFDDLGSCVNFLVDEGHWPESKGKITASEFNFVGSAEKLIGKIEEAGKEHVLRELVGRVWDEIEEQCDVRRKARYV